MHHADQYKYRTLSDLELEQNTFVMFLNCFQVSEALNYEVHVTYSGTSDIYKNLKYLVTHIFYDNDESRKDSDCRDI